MPVIFDRKETDKPSLLLISEDEAKRSIVVSNIPPNISAESVLIHFQKKGNGGGEIERIHVSKAGTAVITFEGSEVMATVLKKSHTLEKSSPQLKVCGLVPDHPVEVFQKVMARIDSSKFNTFFETSRNALKDMKDEANVESIGSPFSNEHILGGTFDQINTAHNLLRGILKGGSKGGEGMIIQHTDRKRNCSGTSEKEATTDDICSFEVQPLLMKLLLRVYETRLKEIKDVYGVNILWKENATQVQICPATTVRDKESYHKGSDEFINLYQDLYLKMRREEIELELSSCKELTTMDICSLEAENNVVIEVKENKLVVYAEETNMSVAVQALKKTFGLLPGNRKGTRRGQRNTKNDTSFPNRPSARVLSQDLMNGVKLSLYQSDITDESADAIVNAANEWLQHGGGVAAAIVRKGGHKIQEESDGLIAHRGRRPLSVGDAVHTRAGTLPSKFVIHTVGPRWNSFPEERCVSLLHRACIESLRLGAQLELCSIALPPISSGIFGMPKDICAKEMFGAVEAFSSSVEAEFSTLRDIRIVIIDDETINVFHEEFLKRYTSQATTPANAVRNEGEPHSSSNISFNVNKLSLLSGKGSEVSHEGHSKETDQAKSPQGDQPSMSSNDPPGQISKSIEEDSKSKLHTPRGIETPNMEIPTRGVDSEQGSNASESSKEIRGTTTSKQSNGRVLAICFPGKPSEEGEPKAEAGTRNNAYDINVDNVKIVRDVTYDNTNVSSPGLAVTEEGKRFAEKHSSEAVSDDSTINHPPSTDKEADTEVNKSENQTSAHGIERQKEELPGGRSNSNPEEVPGFNSEGEQNQNDENTRTHSPEDEQRDTEMDMEVDQATSEESERHLDITQQQNVNKRRNLKDDDNLASSGNAGSDPAPSFAPNENPKMISQDCTTCLNQDRNPVYGSACGHYFCKNCIGSVIEKLGFCPQCKQEKLFPGNQPVGYMTWRTELRKSLPGYETSGTIVVTFNFNGGIQGAEHPNPGERFGGFFCTAYLPHTITGLEVCNLLRRAFNGRLIFTIGKCPATGEDNKIVWNGIELKTGRTGGPANYSYPDLSYLDRVKKELADKGITPLHE
ncbi:uncharacterized protein LOC111344502 [Stylophora pistillata]|uniref:RING-type E3 ubiquitin transferase n=1 Tax=Stylophora pistillata TaxID=50429 RepID=A0A2B4RDV5_STYPI|nr:uncharacterized protein LOC111344502 [Stylophora pistillata]PFX14660.1 E3 ubiquitin-protein ligase DTX3L [Stylophora pistillata]